MELTHASFFSGVGGLDLGLERAGWRTVSFSEIDPYACAVLAERWPGVPNLGDIVRVAAGQPGREARRDSDWTRGWGAACRASLWSGGFPCQDLSVAGKRAGLAGARSGLAYAFLDLVERHRPPAILLENVPGLLSSHRGKDFGALLGRLGELGYWWAYRILDAQHFGVPQRRRRVFIIALHAERGFGADSAAAVLSVGTRCGGHPATGHATREGVTGGASSGVDVLGTLDASHGRKWGSDQWVDPGKGFLRYGQETDPDRVRAPDGLARRLDGDTVGPLLSSTQGGQRSTDLNTPLAFVKRARAQTNEDSESWGAGDVMPTLNSFDVGDARTTAAILGGEPQDDPLLPLGLDSHRYRCCGNGVVSSVAEWIGLRLAEAMA